MQYHLIHTYKSTNIHTHTYNSCYVLLKEKLDNSVMTLNSTHLMFGYNALRENLDILYKPELVWLMPDSYYCLQC